MSRSSICRAVTLLALALAAPLASANTWLTSTHPCPGTLRTDALFRDDDGTLWVGCGSNAVGYGLFQSVDGGNQWQAAPVSPANALSAFRVNSITRGIDGRLKIAGFNATTREMVLALNTNSAAPYPVSQVLVGVPQVGRQFHVGSYRERQASATAIHAIAEALNGVDLLLSTAGQGSSAADWYSTTSNSQILDLIVAEGRFWGAGSSISEPPQLLLPPLNAAASLAFTIAQPQLVSPWDGELWGLAVNAQRLVAVGVDQDNDLGKILVSGPDPRDMGDYLEHSMSQVIGAPSARTWARGVCMQGDRIVVVGERQPLTASSGKVLLSEDGGIQFNDITPGGATASVSKCLFEPDGTLIVVGAGGFVGIRSSTPEIFSSGFEPVP